jgi:hypothetical protein
MQAEFRDLVAGCSEQHLADYLHVSIKTFRRWKSGEATPPHSAIIALRLHLDGDLSAVGGKDWENFRFGRDGKLYLDGWRGGFDPHGIRSMFFTTQLVHHHEATIRQLEKRIAGLEQDVIEANHAAVKYRGLVSHEARLGLMLERITG